MEPLTERQQQVFDFITSYLDNNACPPTLREISSHINAKGTVTAIRHLDALEQKGYIQRRGGSSRSITVNGRGGTITVPIVGTVRAGVPELATEDILGFCQIDTSWLKGRDNFILKVKGSSMIEAGIYDGDYAIIRPQQTAENGEIVVALIDGEATLKRFYREQDHIRFQPENTTMSPIILRAGEAETMIAGRLIKTVRFFE